MFRKNILFQKPHVLYSAILPLGYWRRFKNQDIEQQSYYHKFKLVSTQFQHYKFIRCQKPNICFKVCKSYIAQSNVGFQSYSTLFLEHTRELWSCLTGTINKSYQSRRLCICKAKKNKKKPLIVCAQNQNILVMSFRFDAK